MLRLVAGLALLAFTIPVSVWAYLIFQLGPVAVRAEALTPGEALLRMAAAGALPLALVAAAAHALLTRALLAGGILTRALAVTSLCFLYAALARGLVLALPLLPW
ncbi:MAG: hypothetical protein HY575_09305 [candidate division NC10 bacterium]|nr:hypothetical protein [candidate division NC10 bacterium]MBI4392073.1 hypothetical protein [candidate division NC10 bacterium]